MMGRVELPEIGTDVTARALSATPPSSTDFPNSTVPPNPGATFARIRVGKCIRQATWIRFSRMGENATTRETFRLHNASNADD